MSIDEIQKYELHPLRSGGFSYTPYKPVYRHDRLMIHVGRGAKATQYRLPWHHFVAHGPPAPVKSFEHKFPASAVRSCVFVRSLEKYIQECVKFPVLSSFRIETACFGGRQSQQCEQLIQTAEYTVLSGGQKFMSNYFYPLNRTHMYYMSGDIIRTTREESLEHREYRVEQASRLLNIDRL